MSDVTIIGGGIAGLSTAFYLQQAGVTSYTLVESSGRLGGKVVTRNQDGFVMEGGPDSFITQKPYALQLVRALGLEEELIPCNEAGQSVYIVKDGRLVNLPSGYRLVAPTRWTPFLRSPLLSWRGKLRTGMDLVLPARRGEGDESLASFIRRRFGEEVLETIGGPLMAGIYVADPERLSLEATFPMFAELERRHSSVIKGLVRARRARAGRKAPPMFMSFRSGMETLTRTIEEQLVGDVIRGEAVQRIERRGDRWVVPLSRGPLACRTIVLCTPPGVSSALLKPHDEALARELDRIRSVSTAVLSLGFRKADLAQARPLDGFGFVTPGHEPFRILACTWASTKFAGRAPSDAVLLRAFVGGARDEELAEAPEAAIREAVLRDLRTLMHIEAEPVSTYFARWPGGNPQYDVGHLERVAAVEERLPGLPGLYLAGSGFRGIGLPDCIHGGMLTAKQIAESRPPGT